MNTVMTTYNISLKTMALLPAKKIDYDTIVIKEYGTKYVRQTSLDLIKEACLKYDWTTYEDRRKTVIRHTQFEQKTPIPISIHKGIYVFPTHSPNHPDNIWVACQHILSIGKVLQQQVSKQAQSIVTFKNGQELVLNISYHTLEQQYERTLECVSRIEGIEGLKRIYPW